MTLFYKENFIFAQAIRNEFQDRGVINETARYLESSTLFDEHI